MHKLTEAQISQIKGLDICDLVTFIDACSEASGGLLGIINQPRSRDGVGHTIDSLLANPIHAAQCAAIEVLRSRRPCDRSDLEMRNNCLAIWEIRCDNAAEAVKLLADIHNPEVVSQFKAAAGKQLASAA